MIKRNESKSKFSRRRNSDHVKKKRRLSLEGLERRELLAGGVVTTPPNPNTFTGPRNVGTVQAFSFIESESSTQSGLNDIISQADFVPLGTAPGKQATVDITGTMQFTALNTIPPRFNTDIDTFAFDLRAGDILDIAALGAAGTIDVFYADGTTRWFATDQNQVSDYPADSPLQTVGNAVGAQVVPQDGRYFLTVSPTTPTNAYTVGLRVYRPNAEQLPIGSRQILFLDLDGAVYPRSVFDNTGVPAGGLIRIPSLRDSLPLLGIENMDNAAYNRLIDDVLRQVNDHFHSVAINGGNGYFDATGIPGEYGITILNSRDHIDPGANPLVTRVLVGGSNADAEQQGLLGISETIDVGNFSMDDIVLSLLDEVVPSSTSFPISNTTSVADVAARTIATTISHEAGHSFGLYHTNGDNLIPSLIDEGPGANSPLFYLGAGPDGIIGTLDDTEIDFPFLDEFSVDENIFIGNERVADALAFTLATGTVGGTVTGRVFQDVNRNGIDDGDGGLGGVIVFADVNGDGYQDPSEPSAYTSHDGTYALFAPAGKFDIVVDIPPNFVATTYPGLRVEVATGGVTKKVNFGLSQVETGITGTVFVDIDGDGLRGQYEGGLEDVFVYADLDGDDRPDLGEPSAYTGGDGRYTINFPGPGTYTLRVVTPVAFELTFPHYGEHTFDFNGHTLKDNYDFGLLPSRDFGDAPDSYGTTIAAYGASHGIVSGLMIGDFVDREIDGQPSTYAIGDDFTDYDDEDGVRLISPLGLGATATFEVDVTNTTGAAAYLNAFIDFNGDGDFDDYSEQFVSERLIHNGTVKGIVPLTVTVPAGASEGPTIARFRLSHDAWVGPTGFVSSGEVEDHLFLILPSGEIANDDTFSVSRNTLSNQLDVLANDFQTDDQRLTIDSATDPANGTVVIANDRKSIFYTPSNGYVGPDTFSYTVIDSKGKRSTASVKINVIFQTDVPIAVDDTFKVPQGSVNRPLNVLDNDVSSIAGGLSITSVAPVNVPPGTATGTIQIVGGQSLNYTPVPGFTGTEQFSYSIQDSQGNVSTATVTINMSPGSALDDMIDFKIEFFDAVNIDVPIDNVQVGDKFLVRVSVDDLRASSAARDGVASAFLDLLYTDELVMTTDTNSADSFNFDISFGEFFSAPGGLQLANAQTPGLIDEVGGVQPISNQQTHNGFTELFTVRMMAVSPGTATFRSDPADNLRSENVLLDSDIAVPVAKQGHAMTTLQILPASKDFPSAIDDSFPDSLDSRGNLISSTSPNRNRLDVLANDNFGTTGTITSFSVLTDPSLGNVFVDDNGTPTKLNDDFLSYRANPGANGLEQFRYEIVTADNIRRTAEVSISLGTASDSALVAYNFVLVADDGATPISRVEVGQRFGVQVIAEDLSTSRPTYVYAGFLDVLYDADVIRPANTIPGDEFNFDVVFGPGYIADAGVGTASRRGIIDEFGTLHADVPEPNNPLVLATLFFDKIAPGSAKVVADPADSFPFQQTLLYQRNEPVEIDQIRYGSLMINGGSGTSQSAFQNPVLAQDVNNDGAVSAIDALLVINQMNRITEGEGEQAGAGSIASSYFVDVNGDNTVSALDALQVINFLTRGSSSSSSGEGESIVAQSLPSTATDLGSSEPISDTVFADLNESGQIKDATVVQPSVQAVASISGTSNGLDDREDDTDMLNLLADDVSGLWS